MSRSIRAIAVVVLVASSLACASSSGTSKPNARVRPPELLTRSRPDIVPTGVIPNSARPTTLVDIEVQVNPDGSPDMNTLKITGPGAGTNRSSVTTWVQGLRFKPATQGGIPVAATWKTSFSAMIRTSVVR